MSQEDLDVCCEVPMDAVRFAMNLARPASASSLPFRPQAPPLTLFEICKEVCCSEFAHHNVQTLQLMAQQRLKAIIFDGKATLREVVSLIRAGAEPLRQHVTLCQDAYRGELNSLDDSGSGRSFKRARIEAEQFPPGTVLHWACGKAFSLPPHLLANYQDIIRWLCDAAPLALLLTDDRQRTPLELVLEFASRSAAGKEGLLCAMCGRRGHTGRTCGTALEGLGGGARQAELQLSLLSLLAEGLAVAADRYPLRAAALLAGAEPFRLAARRAEALLQPAAPEGPRALEALQRFLAVGGAPGDALPIAIDACVAAEHLGGAAAARARSRLISSVAGGAAEELRAADAQEASARLAECERLRRREAERWEAKAEALEAELASAQRRLEEAEARAEAALAAVRDAGDAPPRTAEAKARGEAPGLGEGRPAAAGASAAHAGMPPEAFVAALRRERLVDVGDLEGAPESLRLGVSQLSRSLCAAVERLAEDLYESECHFVYEVVQNAEDAHRRARPAASGPSTLSLRIRGLGSGRSGAGYFVSESNEAGFTHADVAAICDISASSKKKSGSGATIGCKGIGFKSVFTVSNHPHVLSREFTFAFDVQGPLGKLGYVTPSWLTPADLAALPPDVQKAHAAGLTVLYLPLKRPGLAAEIQREMEQLVDVGRATLLFLRQLEVIELVPTGAQPVTLRRKLTSEHPEFAVVEEETSGRVTEHRYHVHRHSVRDPGGDAPIDLALAFPFPPEVAQEADADECKAKDPPRLEPIFCSLPVRIVGFGFALHCDRFNLVANRGDLHHGSPANRAVRDALPGAFVGACAALPEVARRSLALLGEAVAEPFWRPAREGALQGLAGVACVATGAGARRPTEVLLRGTGPLSEVAGLLPAELLLRSCGRALAAECGGGAEERLLKRLGAQAFSLDHLCKCLAFREEPWPCGWVSAMWAGSSPDAAVALLRTIYRCLASSVLDVRSDGAGSEIASAIAPQLDDVLMLTRLQIFPLESGGCSSVASGPIFRGTCATLSQDLQMLLAKVGRLRVLPSTLVQALDSGACRLLDALSIGVLTVAEVARIALETHLTLSVQEVMDSQKQPAIRGSIELLGEVWLRGGDDGDLRGVLDEVLAQVALQGADSRGHGGGEAARQCPAVLSDFVLLPGRSGRLQGPRRLLCPTLFGMETTLAPDVLSRIDAFLGLPAASGAGPGAEAPPPGPAAALPLAAEPVDLWPRALKADPLAWEAFLVDGLGLRPLRPLDPRQPRAPPDLALAIGKALGDDGADGLWRGLLDRGEAPASRVLAYVGRRAQHAADVAWLADLPVRRGAAHSPAAPLRVRDLFLRSAYFSLAGGSLEGTYLDLPLAASSSTPSCSSAPGPTLQSSRRAQDVVLHFLQALGANCHVSAHGVAAALATAVSWRCRDTATFARLYCAFSKVDDDDGDTDEGVFQTMRRQAAEILLRKNIFHPDHAAPLQAGSCIWAPPASCLVSGCAGLVSLHSAYAPFGASRLERYFVARGIPVGLSTARGWLGALGGLLEAAEDLGRKWRTSPTPEAMSVTLGGSGSSKSMAADTFLAEVWPAVVSIYKGMAALPSDERTALRPFSPAEPLVVVPLSCPHGGPPEEQGMLPVACFHDGAIFRRLPVGEAFWEVAPDLAHSRAAEWALASFFPPELRDVFVHGLGVREAVDRAALREGLARGGGGAREWPARRGRGGAPPGLPRGAGLVNESGLPSDLVDLAAGPEGRSGRGRRGPAGAAESAAAALALLRGGGGGRPARERGGSRSPRRGGARGAGGDGEVLVSAALPARSVRCPATRARRLVRVGTVDAGEGSRPRQRRGGGGGGAQIALYVAEEDGQVPGEGRARARRGELCGLAAVLRRLAEEVFRVPSSRVAIVVAEGSDGLAAALDCGLDGGDGAWPLLFPAHLLSESGEEPSFWLGEFCHALAHRAVGPEHSSEHVRVAQVLLSQHLPSFSRVFGCSTGGQ